MIQNRFVELLKENPGFKNANEQFISDKENDKTNQFLVI